MMVDKSYTFEQTGAIGAMFAAAIWGIAAIGGYVAAGQFGDFEVIMFSIFDVVFWITLLLQFRQLKWGFLIGFITQLVGIVISIPPTTTGYVWYSFANPILDFSVVVQVLIMVVGIYFSYMSYKQLE
ncbi:MAG: hypothetical protein ACW99U_06120 [Candidatus Thorarchaeota archaeon]|jgi:hypothetical protein